MRSQPLTTIGAVFLLGLSPDIPAIAAESNEQYERVAVSIWNAFQCSYKADELRLVYTLHPQLPKDREVQERAARMDKEKQRLFAYGLSQGRKLAQAISDGRVSMSELSNVPGHVSMFLDPLYIYKLREGLQSGSPLPPSKLLIPEVLEGQTIDFLLGRAYEHAGEIVRKELTDNKLTFEGASATGWGRIELEVDNFLSGNCTLLGQE